MSELRDALVALADELETKRHGYGYAYDGGCQYAASRIRALATPEGATCDGSGITVTGSGPDAVEEYCPGCPACRVEGGSGMRNWYVKHATKMIEYGQDPATGDLIFAVRVSGLGAKPHSPEQEARRLVWLFNEVVQNAEPFVRVSLEEPDRDESSVGGE